MGMDIRGDPASALLEVLDPEQNSTFNDHYLEVDYRPFGCVLHLHVEFDEHSACAPGSNGSDPPSRIHGRRKAEHCEALPRAEAESHNGLKPDELKAPTRRCSTSALLHARSGCAQARTRDCQDLPQGGQADAAAQEGAKSVAITPRNLDKFLGVRRFRYGKAEDMNRIGQVTGLAWTEVGGELLTIEAAVVPGKGKLQHTGQLGEVMQESIQAAMTVVRSRAQVLGLEPEFYQKHDVHLHIPEGATPKDGPSAGIGMCTALVSALTRIPVRSDVAMTGEITLRGEVLPIGGLKEKLLAAHRGGIKTVLIPDENQKDLVEIPDNIKGNLEIKPVKWIDEVLAVALTQQPMPQQSADGTPAVVPVAAAEEKPVRRGVRRLKQDVPPAH